MIRSRSLLLACLSLFLLAPGSGPQGSLSLTSSPVVVGPTAWYITGPSNFSACCDLPWPPDNGVSNLGPSLPGDSNRGWWNAIKYHIKPAGVGLAPRNNSSSGHSVGNYLHPRVCRENAGSLYRTETCSSDDATGDQECDLINDGVDDNDATCETSTTYYLEGTGATTEGIQSLLPARVIFGPGPNECAVQQGMTVAKIIDATRDLLDGFFAYSPRIEKVYLHMGLSWHKRFASAIAVCANLWEFSCDQPSLGGSDCSNTFDDLAAEYGGKVEIMDTAFQNTVGETTLSGAASLYEMYTNDELHVNIWGWYAEELPEILGVLGTPVTDTPPSTPVPVVDSVTDTTATISLDAAVTDAEGDTLTCILWAHESDTSWLGGYLQADRVHNVWAFAKAKGGGTPPANCGDTSADDDCSTGSNNYTDADAAAGFWFTPQSDPALPILPDCTSVGARCMPDFFQIPCNASGTATLVGLAPNTEYRLLAQAWPTIVSGRVDKGIRPSVINDTITFTTDP